MRLGYLEMSLLNKTHSLLSAELLQSLFPQQCQCHLTLKMQLQFRRRNSELTCGLGSIMPGAGPPTPRAGPDSPGAAGPGGIAMPLPTAFAMPTPGAAFFACKGCCSSAGGGPSSTSETISSPLKMIRPKTRLSSRCKAFLPPAETRLSKFS
jgi:hypothetical protein